MKNLCIYILLLFSWACSKSVEERSHTVVNVLDGNTIQLKNGLTVELIGVEDTPEAYQYLVDNLMNKKIRFTTDRSNRYNIKSKVQEIHAYIRTIKGVSVNGELLKGRFTTLRTEYLTDSLTVFRTYADRDNAIAENLTRAPSKIRKKDMQLPEEPYRELETKSLRQLVKIAEPCVFLIYAMDENGKINGSGTGFFINESGLAVSNYHVFKDASSWKIKTRDGKFYPVTSIINSDENIDYLVFKVNISRSPYLKIADQLPEKGEDIFVLGNPKGLESTVTRGVVSAFRNVNTRNDFIQIDAAISPGSSGSPVMNMEGDVIGIATAKLDACESCNFAVNIQLVENTLEAE